MSPADLDLAQELRARMPETMYDLPESWVVEGDGRRVVRGRLAGMRFVFHPDAFRWVPDLHDPTGATAGVLLAMLPTGWSVFDRLAVSGGRSVVIKLRGAVSIAYEGPTLAAAAALALLAAWGPA